MNILVEGRAGFQDSVGPMYVVGQVGDCGTGVRIARVLARERGYSGARVHPIVLYSRDTTSDLEDLPRLDAYRSRLLVWGLWMRGVRSTPVLVDFTKRRVRGEVTVLVRRRNGEIT